MKNAKGFTLVELLVAMSVATLIAMAFFTIMNISIKNNTKNEKDIKLLNVATSELENIREQIKETSSGEIIVNMVSDDKSKYISIDEWQNEKISKVNPDLEDYYKLENGILFIGTIVDNEKYNMELEIKRSIVEGTEMYLYDTSIQVKLANDNFSKRNIELSTKIFGR